MLFCLCWDRRWIGIERAIAGYLDLYATLVALELRRQEQIPAWEGILLVKARET
jgi:hypothetical protein